MEKKVLFIANFLLVALFASALGHPACDYKDSCKQSLKRNFVKFSVTGEEYRHSMDRVKPYVERHAADPQWILSRMAMYWKDGSVRLSFQLKNTDKRAGTEIAQVYIRRTEDVNGPIKTLRDFRRVTLQPGETQTVSFVMQPDQFETFDEATNTMRVMPGKYTLMYGGSSAEHSLKTIQIDLK